MVNSACGGLLPLGGSGRKGDVLGVRTLRGRVCAVGVALAVAGVGVIGVVGADAATFTPKTTEEFVKSVAEANANKQANTIVLSGVAYNPSKTVVFSNTSGLQTIEGPAGLPNTKGATANLTGQSVEPTGSELLVVNPGVSVKLKDVEISGGGGKGLPGVEDQGTLALEDSLVANIGASVTVQGGATLTAKNTTIADGRDIGVVNGGTASFTNSTVAYNQVGGIENTGVLNLTNTIVAENASKGGKDCEGKATTSDHSLDSDGSCGVAGNGLSKTKALLQEHLEVGGGTVPLHSLKAASPAIGKGDEATCLATDQRGAKRAKLCSIGADEYTSTAPTIKVPEDITEKQNEPEGAVVTFAATATGVESAIKSVECSPAPESLFPVGKTEVTCTAVDGHENKAVGHFFVTVTPEGAIAPAVVTSAVGSVTQTGATLKATVNPEGSEVTVCEFEYGTTLSYGKMAPCSALPGSGSSPVAVSAAVTGLTANTTYDYRIVAKNAGGETKGLNETFKTLEESNVKAPEVVTGGASELSKIGTTVGATLGGTVNPNGGEVTLCKFEYGMSTEPYEKSVPCAKLPGSGSSPESVYAKVTGLPLESTYHFRIVAANAGGERVGADATFVTLPRAPVATTGAAESIKQETAKVKGTVNPEGGEVTACEVEYGISTAYGQSAQCATPPGSGMSPVEVFASLKGLVANTTYDYRVVAKNAGGASYGANASFTTLEPPGPPVVTTTEATGVGPEWALMNATVNPHYSLVTSCEFEYGTTAALGKTVSCAEKPPKATGTPVSVFSALTGLTPSTTYYYRIVAKNALGERVGLGGTFKTIAKEPPTFEAVVAHGVLRGSGRAPVQFSLNLEVESETGTFRYIDPARHIALSKLNATSLVINGARGTATLHGSVFDRATKRRVRITLVLENHRGVRSLRIHLANGYTKSARLRSGAIKFVASPVY